jgi:3-isopropylmalate/(R)-2-methylmalate dehydratase small subunit
MADDPRRIDRVEGTAIPLRGEHIDTDRIMPARFLRSVTFEGLEAHLFEDDRTQLAASGAVHPFSNPAYLGASILIVNGNFGCGSSREHAPQALQRWGIRAIVGESFSEIFLANSLTLGLPCLSIEAGAALDLQTLVERDPELPVSVSVGELSVSAGSRRVVASMAPQTRTALLTGAWDATGMLLDGYDEVRRLAARLPYISGFEAPDTIEP